MLKLFDRRIMDLCNKRDGFIKNKAKEEVRKFQKELMKWDGPANAAQFLLKTFGE